MTILFVSLSWHLFLLRCDFSPPIPYGMHLVAPAQLCPFGWCVIPAGHFPQKSTGRNLKIGFPLSPPLTFDPWPHCILYWLGTGWWGLGLARAFLPYISKICLPLTHPPWSEGFPAQFAIYFLTFLCELLFDFPLPLGARPLLLLGFTFLLTHFLIVLISCHVTLSFLL